METVNFQLKVLSKYFLILINYEFNKFLNFQTTHDHTLEAHRVPKQRRYDRSSSNSLENYPKSSNESLLDKFPRIDPAENH